MVARQPQVKLQASHGHASPACIAPARAQKGLVLHINDLTYRIGGRIILDAPRAPSRMAPASGWSAPTGPARRRCSGLSKATSARRRNNFAAAAPAHRRGRAGGAGRRGAADRRGAGSRHRTQRADRRGGNDRRPLRRAEIETRLVDIGAHSAPARAAAILHGLGFDAAAQARSCASFSGGWRMRVALAAVLFSAPDMLLLDEPTNYLDLEGTLWLYDYLDRYPHTFIVISHDRELLDTVADHILFLDRGKLTIYRGGYTSFDRQRRERQALETKRASSRRRSASTCRPSSTASAPKRRRPARRSRASSGSPRWSRSRRWRRPRCWLRLPSPGAPVAAHHRHGGRGGRLRRPCVLNRSTCRWRPTTASRCSVRTAMASRRLRSSSRPPGASGAMRARPSCGPAYFAQHQLDELNPAPAPISTWPS